jgi:hypothetical protein
LLLLPNNPFRIRCCLSGLQGADDRLTRTRLLLTGLASEAFSPNRLSSRRRKGSFEAIETAGQECGVLGGLGRSLLRLLPRLDTVGEKLQQTITLVAEGEKRLRRCSQAFLCLLLGHFPALVFSGMHLYQPDADKNGCCYQQPPCEITHANP